MVCLCAYARGVDAQGGQRLRLSLQLPLQVLVDCRMGVLGTEFMSLGRIVRALNH